MKWAMNKAIFFSGVLLILFSFISCAPKEIQPQPKPAKIAVVLEQVQQKDLLISEYSRFLNQIKSLYI